ncbi:MAG TPA: hypothetical protein EYP60_03255, partial [bacterium (Candidatus Stahlbacteria)]|nr:hypothetical protein [Candidatus Stahlbacteria bacterium]
MNKVILYVTLSIAFNFLLYDASSAKAKKTAPVKDAAPSSATVRELIKEGEFEKAWHLCDELGEEGTFLKAEIAYFKGDFDTAIKFYKI